MMKLTALLDNAMRNIFEEFPECSEGLETISSPFFFFFSKMISCYCSEVSNSGFNFFSILPFFSLPFRKLFKNYSKYFI